MISERFLLRAPCKWSRFSSSPTWIAELRHRLIDAHEGFHCASSRRPIVDRLARHGVTTWSPGGHTVSMAGARPGSLRVSTGAAPFVSGLLWPPLGAEPIRQMLRRESPRPLSNRLPPRKIPILIANLQVASISHERTRWKFIIPPAASVIIILASREVERLGFELNEPLHCGGVRFPFAGRPKVRVASIAQHYRPE